MLELTFHLQEIEKLLKGLEIKKATRPHEIPATVLSTRTLCKLFVSYLCRNCCIPLSSCITKKKKEGTYQ